MSGPKIALDPGRAEPGHRQQVVIAGLRDGLPEPPPGVGARAHREPPGAHRRGRHGHIGDRALPHRRQHRDGAGADQERRRQVPAPPDQRNVRVDQGGQPLEYRRGLFVGHLASRIARNRRAGLYPAAPCPSFRPREPGGEIRHPGRDTLLDGYMSGRHIQPMREWFEKHGGHWTFGLFLLALLGALGGMGVWGLNAQDARQNARVEERFRRRGKGVRRRRLRHTACRGKSRGRDQEARQPGGQQPRTDQADRRQVRPGGRKA